MDLYVEILHVVVFLLGCAVIMYRFEIKVSNREAEYWHGQADVERKYGRDLVELVKERNAQIKNLQSKE